jgi:BASS family bile acid:Na+ symporter
VPLIVGASLLYFMDTSSVVNLPIGQLVGGLFLVTLLPLGLGLWLSESQRLGAQAVQLVHRAATTVFILIVGFTFFDQWPAITSHLPALGPACLLLNLVTMGTGALLGILSGLTSAERVALAMECGIQNSALGITLALSMLAMPALAIPSVIYAVLMNASALGVILWRRAQPVASTA